MRVRLVCHASYVSKPNPSLLLPPTNTNTDSRKPYVEMGKCWTFARVNHQMLESLRGVYKADENKAVRVRWLACVWMDGLKGVRVSFGYFALLPPPVAFALLLLTHRSTLKPPLNPINTHTHTHTYPPITDRAHRRHAPSVLQGPLVGAQNQDGRAQTRDGRKAARAPAGGGGGER